MSHSIVKVTKPEDKKLQFFLNKQFHISHQKSLSEQEKSEMTIICKHDVGLIANEIELKLFEKSYLQKNRVSVYRMLQ